MTPWARISVPWRPTSRDTGKAHLQPVGTMRSKSCASPCRKSSSWPDTRWERGWRSRSPCAGPSASARSCSRAAPPGSPTRRSARAAAPKTSSSPNPSSAAAFPLSSQSGRLAGLRDLSPSLLAAVRGRRLRQSAEGLASALRHLGSGAQPPLWDEVPGLRAPVLLVAGERDAKFGAIARDMAGAISGSRVVLVPSSGHSPHLEAPERYAATLAAFFTQHGGDRR